MIFSNHDVSRLFRQEGMSVPLTIFDSYPGVISVRRWPSSSSGPADIVICYRAGSSVMTVSGSWVE
jgi:hypothetical protein